MSEYEKGFEADQHATELEALRAERRKIIQYMDGVRDAARRRKNRTDEVIAAIRADLERLQKVVDELCDESIASSDGREACRIAGLMT